MTEKKRMLTDWLSTYIDYTAIQESPENFHLWSGISMIASAIGRKAWIHRLFFTTYPNHYIVIVSPSALCSKSTAVKIGTSLFNNAFEKNDISSKKMTLERVMVVMAKVAKATGTSTTTIFSDELSVLVGRSGQCELMDFLTEVYDCKDKWTNETKTKGVDSLVNVCVNFIACTTPEDLAKMPSSMIDGGFSGRNIFVYGDVPRRPESLVDVSETYIKSLSKMEEALIHDLQLIGEISGEYKLSAEAKILYDSIYINNRQKDYGDTRMSPYQGRKGEHLIKLSMIIAASHSDKLIVDEVDINAANTFLTGIEATMMDAFMGINYSTDSQHVERVLSLIKKTPNIPHSKLLKAVYRFLNSDGLKKVVGTLEGAHMIDIFVNANTTYYRAKGVKG